MKKVIAAVMALLMLLSTVVVVGVSAAEKTKVGTIGRTNGTVVLDGKQDPMYGGSLNAKQGDGNDPYHIDSFCILFSDDFKTMYVSGELQIESNIVDDEATHNESDNDIFWFGVDFGNDGKDALTASLTRAGVGEVDWPGRTFTKGVECDWAIYNAHFTEKTEDNDIYSRTAFEWMFDVSEYNVKTGDEIGIAAGIVNYTEDESGLVLNYCGAERNDPANWPYVVVRDYYDYTVLDESAKEIRVNRYSGYDDGLYAVPSQIDGYTVVEIGERAYEDNTMFTEVTIPNTVRRIRDRAFSFCSNLQKITYPESVTEWGNMINYHDPALATVIVPDNMTRIPDAMFRQCQAMKEFKYPSALEEIGTEAFYNNRLSDMNIPDGVVRIGDRAYYAGRASMTLTIPASVRSIGDEAFCYVSATTCYFYSEDCNINDRAFRQDYMMKFVAVPGSASADVIELFISRTRNYITEYDHFDPSFGYTFRCADGHHLWGDVSVVSAPAKEGKNARVNATCYYCGMGAGTLSGGKFTAKPISLSYDEWTAICKAAGIDPLSKPAAGTVVKAGNNLAFPNFAWSSVPVGDDDADWDYMGDLDKLAAISGKQHPWVNCAHVLDTKEASENISAPDCVNPGVSKGTCKVCGFSDVEALTPALGHDFSGEFVKTKDGHAQKCTRCPEVDTVVAHTYDVNDCSVVATCLICSYEKAAGDHGWGEWVIKTPVTCIADGEKIRTCSICQDTESEIIVSEGHQIEYVPAKEATLDEAGNNEYYYCPICECAFKDEAATVPTTVEAETIPQLAWTNPFKDVKKSSWFFAAARFVNYYGMINGISPTTFEPNTPMTRGMLVTVLYRYEGEPVPEGQNPFSDVKDKEYYAKPIIWAAENGIVSGVGGDRFNPKGNLTREQIAKIMFGYASLSGCIMTDREDISKFPDYKKVSSWATDYMSWAYAKGLITGNTSASGATVLDPQGNATRAQVATIMMRLVQNILQAD